MQQAEAIGVEQQILRRGVADDIRCGWFQAAGADILERNVKLLGLGLPAVDGCSHQHVPGLGIHPPEAIAVGDDTSRSESGFRHRGSPFCTS
jgi:hypothetical protein